MKLQHKLMRRLVIVAVLLLICTALFSACNQGSNNPIGRPSGSSKETSKATHPYGDPFTNHTHEFGEWIVKLEPTCTETGLAEGKHCSVCNTILVKQEVVKANGHTEVIDEAVASGIKKLVAELKI